MKKTILLLLTSNLLLGAGAYAQAAATPVKEAFDPVAVVLLTAIIGLAIVIIVLGNAVIGAIDIFRERMKKDAEKVAAVAAIIGLTLLSHSANAQGVFSTLSPVSYYLLLSVLGVELLVVICLLFVLRFLVGIKSRKKAKAISISKPRVNWFEKINKTQSLDAASEEEADMGHNYDGIRELNNPTPPWWKWGFLFTIAFGIVYTWRTEVSHAAPNQLEELAAAEEKAAIAKEEYLKKAANNIDENNVTLLTEPADLAAGQKIFAASCAPCHGPQGQGVVGPNLTDDYWLHGGKINEIFKTIKYGVAEKGMKAWQEDFSPKQLAQIASYVKSIHGSNPPNPKEPQGQKE
ncbi:cytochrome c oxidase cbb3-type subunit 3 [Chitinophaga terrae (ex Kim and Jung 2007)]|uniref:cbb3-type cytochrome c oxidase N-terminal domain-containing protein n=1 Tax=Chitinophaga terrae (ex Kim and Jung 2007) TaxID=408074 RepID=UPI0027825397|nr:cbb3-type cytochrome c oxidase N-terminal domain-containing protein [Chitinophaga terrae (ex Kim and Jung 2007)]MDQ0105396.1 cytochrome c oxidase cbb3-type subunit 3 [Chitinophaga terrae (ex Kim and Jung 2007)]